VVLCALAAIVFIAMAPVRGTATPGTSLEVAVSHRHRARQWKILRGCLRKRPYDSEWHAQDKIGGRNLSYYKCEFCQKWHLTSRVQENETTRP
jgi:hypothetical protein